MQLHHLDNSFLAMYRPARLRFTDSDALPKTIRPVWDALRAQQHRLALRHGYKLLRENELDENERAAVLAALSSAELDNGVAAEARRMARESIDLVEHQWMAHRVLLTAHLSDGSFDTCSNLLDGIPTTMKTPVWDEPLSKSDRHVLRAAISWMTQHWDDTAAQLSDAYPDGVAQMPRALQEDWFRLAFYRDESKDAADAASELIGGHSSEKADILIQTLVRQGWHREALQLYRTIYDQDPSSELLRRRVVGLCIREGNVKEARRLMEQGALRLAV
ncbi:MAG: hypothetical protein WD021_09595 [Rhodothermales bacterium]